MALFFGLLFLAISVIFLWNGDDGNRQHYIILANIWLAARWLSKRRGDAE